MKNYTIGANGYTMLMTSDGTFVYHPTSSLIDKKIQDMKISDRVSKAISSKSSQLLNYTVNGNLDVTIDDQSDDEVGELGRSIEKTVSRLKEYIDYIDEISNVLADMAEETSATSEELAAQAVTLNELVQRFEI